MWKAVSFHSFQYIRNFQPFRISLMVWCSESALVVVSRNAIALSLIFMTPFGLNPKFQHHNSALLLMWCYARVILYQREFFCRNFTFLHCFFIEYCWCLHACIAFLDDRVCGRVAFGDGKLCYLYAFLTPRWPVLYQPNGENDIPIYIYKGTEKSTV
jgi:hypothetical protein